jgi:galactokinase
VLGERNSERAARSSSANGASLDRRARDESDAIPRGVRRAVAMTTSSRSRLLDAIGARFRSELGGSGDVRRFFAPGRINLVGAHLDYNGGDVLPMAVDRGIYLAIRARDDGRLRLRSLDLELAVDVDGSAVGERAAPEHGWAAYPLGVWKGFVRAHGAGAGGFDAVFGGDLPIASGLSSSAAIEVVTALALDALHGTRLERDELARIAHAAETGFVGVRCGIMDQFASALGRAGQVLLLHCAGPRWEHVPFDPAACELLVLDTKKPRLLAQSGFNERVAQCAAVHAVLRRDVRDLPHLAHYTRADLDRVAGELDPVLLRRARHVVTEMERTRDGALALRAHDYEALGELLDASHRSTAEDYEVSCDELDVITAAARECDGVFGSRLTGAGFGGCAIALLQPGAAAEVQRHVAAAFRARFHVDADFYLLRNGTGPVEIR